LWEEVGGQNIKMDMLQSIMKILEKAQERRIHIERCREHRMAIGNCYCERKSARSLKQCSDERHCGTHDDRARDERYKVPKRCGAK
jgi:hypothetical protein